MARKELPPRLEQRQGYWYVIHSEAGRSCRTSLRTDDLQIAQERFNGWLKEREAYEVAKKAPTVELAFKHYLEQHGERRAASPETLRFIRDSLNRFFGDMPLVEITSKHIHRFIDERRKGLRVTLPHGKTERRKPVSDGTIRKELTILRAVFAFMCQRVEPVELRQDPRALCYIELPPRPAPRERVISDKEIERIRALAAPPPAPATIGRLELYLWLLMETGARSGALRELTWKQVNLKDGFIQLNPWGREQTKKRRPIVPISDDLRPILERAKAEKHSEYVLGHTGQIRKSFERFCEKNNLAHVTAHTFRHTLATRMAQAGVSMVEIAQILGDQLVTVEKNYLHYQPEFLRGAINAISVRRSSALPTDQAANSDEINSAEKRKFAFNAS